MHSNRIENRITDLLKLAGFSDEQTIEELTDHFLTHIEEEVSRGVNAQQAIRETFQEVASMNASQFLTTKSSKDKRGLFLFLLIFIGISFYLFFQSQPLSNYNLPQQNTEKDIAVISPPSGLPIHQSTLKVSSEFGLRINPFQNKPVNHNGIDIRAKIGTPVLSTGGGIIKEAGYNDKAGKYVIIQHPGNYLTKYYHLSDISVAKNENVKQGQVIGKVGNSGLSMMPHLHYEVLKNEIPVNPRDFIKP